MFATLGVLGLAPVASASPTVQTCLIANGGSGGHFGKTLLCAEVRRFGPNTVAYGRVSTDGPAGNRVTVTLELRTDRWHADWQVLATVSTHGFGQIDASTRPIWVHDHGDLRACVAVDPDRHDPDRHDRPTQRLCTMD